MEKKPFPNRGIVKTYEPNDYSENKDESTNNNDNNDNNNKDKNETKKDKITKE